VKLDTDSITNLFSIVRDNTIQAHDQFQQMARDILYKLTITIFLNKVMIS